MPAITIITAWDMDRRRFVFCPSDGEKLDLAGAVYIFPDGTEPGTYIAGVYDSAASMAPGYCPAFSSI